MKIRFKVQGSSCDNYSLSGAERLLRTTYHVLRIGLALSAFSILHSPLVYAAPNQGVNLVTSPLPVSLVAKPGTSVSAELRVKNGGTQPERLKVTLMKFSAFGEEGKPLLADREAGDDYFDWVTFTPSVFDAPPGEWQTITMTVTLPKSAAFGYYYAPVFSRATVDKPADSKTNALIGSTAILVLLEAQVPGAKRDLQLKAFTADRSFYEFLPTEFSIKLHNNGNVHLAPRGNIFIYQGKQQVDVIEVNSGRGNILPGTNRIYDADWSDGFPAYAPKTNSGETVQSVGQSPKMLKWDWSQITKLRFGHYTAKLTMVYDNGTRDVPLEATLSFWVIPWRLIIGLLAIPVVPATVVYVVMRRKYRKRL